MVGKGIFQPYELYHHRRRPLLFLDAVALYSIPQLPQPSQGMLSDCLASYNNNNNDKKLLILRFLTHGGIIIQLSLDSHSPSASIDGVPDITNDSSFLKG